ncbi:MAG: VanW family protein [Candidatus Sabulitectum sp.]|nr:VanW family protein [Candidatus Sabulitectum sp.]
MSIRKPLSSRNPFFYRISVGLHRLKRRCSWYFSGESYSSNLTDELFPYVVVSHSSLLLRKLAGTDIDLQKNKVQSLRIAVSFIDGLVVAQSEVFSFWKLVGNPVSSRGFPPGLQLSFGKLTSMAGGGLCQLTNLLHWMVLHTSLGVTERHRHSTDPFPDYKRIVPFGTGATVFYNYLDLAFRNNTSSCFQLKIWLDDEYLCGEIRCREALPVAYSIVEKNHRFIRENGIVYRENELWRIETDRESSRILSEKLLFKNHVEVLYDVSSVPGLIVEGGKE